MVATDPISPETRRFACRLPRPLWIGLAMVVLIVVAVGLRFGIPIYRHEGAIRVIERAGGHVDDYMEQTGPPWLRDWVGDRWMQALYGPTAVTGGEKFSDAEMATFPHWRT